MITNEDDDDEGCEWWQFLPFMLCISMFLFVVLYIILDFEAAIKTFADIIDYIKEKPYESIAIVIIAYIFIILFILPISAFMILTGYAYSKAFDSFDTGFAVALSVSFVGIILGSMIAFFLGRLMFKDYIKKKIDKS